MAKIRNGYDQVSSLTQDTTWESDNKSPEVSLFPAGDHKATLTDWKALQTQGINNTN